MSIVRASKLRHVFGEEQKLKFEELRPASLTSEGHLVKCNGEFVAFNWRISGGGALCVLSMNETGRLPVDHALIKGHPLSILDFDFNPFNDHQILTSCEDSSIRLWEFPAEGLKEDLVEPLAVMRGHTRKVGLLTFNPAAAYICASASFDYTVKVWNLETGTAAYSIGPLAETCLCLSWDSSGRLLGTTWRDKKTRLIDPRSHLIAQEFLSHEGGKASKFSWINDTTCFTCGFSKQSERQYCLWDIRDAARPLSQQTIDQAAGVLMPFFDADTGLLFLAGKGDGNIRYYEVVNTEPYIHFVQSYKSSIPCQGVTFIPKRKVNVEKCEVMRAVKLANSTIEMISFIVPRRAEGFQEDLYPETVGMVPGCSAAQWMEGSNAQPPKISLNNEENGERRETAKLVFNPVMGDVPIPTSPAHYHPVTEQETKQIADLKTALELNQAKIATLQGEAAAHTAQLATTQQALLDSHSLTTHLQSTLQQAQQDHQDAIQTIALLEEQTSFNSENQQIVIEELQQETEKMREELAEMQREVMKSKRWEEEVLAELERVQKELDAARLGPAEQQ